MLKNLTLIAPMCVFGLTFGGVLSAFYLLEAQRRFRTKVRVLSWMEKGSTTRSDQADWVAKRASYEKRVTTVRLCSLLLGAIAFFFSRNVVLAITVTIFIGWLHSQLSDYSRRRRMLLLREQLYTALHSMVGYLRAGCDISRVVELILEETQDPLKSDLARVVAEHYAGIPFTVALRRWAVRTNDTAIWTFVKAVDIHRSTGGNLVQMIFEIADAMAQRKAVQKDVQARISDPQLTAMFLALLPPSLVVFMLMVDPQMLQPLLHHPTGRLAVSYSCVSWLVGSFLVRKLTDLKIGW